MTLIISLIILVLILLSLILVIVFWENCIEIRSIPIEFGCQFCLKTGLFYTCPTVPVDSDWLICISTGIKVVLIRV